MEKKEIVITHETLFEILKREKDRTELQKLDASFFEDVVNYIREKRSILGNESPFSADEKRNTERQIENIRRILKDLYDKREKKVIGMALDKSRTKSNVMDTSALLNEEKMLFESLVALFDKFRQEILYSLLNESVPAIEERKAENEKMERAEEKSEARKDTKLVRFVHAVPKFVGKELEEYGPFEEDDIANLPNEIADVLMLKGRAEEIRED
ncbi:MAG TPA: hypothetical protein VJL89_10005 [Thermodesulfovibrionia bacterium]|nr:hypothetical protein [Candidatus Woesearchaeota archaeon]HLC16544.1 hypothetical protein [Thermodesulfovibrionia bacterium]